MALKLGRRAVGFEVNQNSFEHHINEIKKIKPGEMLKELKYGKADLPKNQKKPWSKADLTLLEKRYNQLIRKKQTKRQAISALQEEFGRGYFAILNKISEISGR